MNLFEAVDLTLTTRPTWRDGKGAETARINIGHVLRIIGGEVEVTDITTRHFDMITEAMMRDGKASSTINRITSALSTVLAHVRKKGYAAAKVEYERQKEGRGRVEYFTEEEVEKLIVTSLLESDRLLLHDSLVFASKTGCRRSELLKLLDSDIDIDKRTILFRDTKNGQDHWLRMHDDLVPILERRLSFVGCEGYLFDWLNGDQLLSSFKSLKLKTGFSVNDKRVWHHIRHSVATWLCEKEVPLRTVMGVLNHSRVETTLRYAKASDKAVNAAIDLL